MTRKPKIFHWCLLDKECRRDMKSYGGPYNIYLNRLKDKHGNSIVWTPPFCHNKKRHDKFWANAEPVKLEVRCSYCKSMPVVGSNIEHLEDGGQIWHMACEEHFEEENGTLGNI